MKKKDKIIEWISNQKGNLIGIGIDQKPYLEEIMKNKNILECNLLESISLEEGSGKRKKYLPIKKLKRKFKRKKTDALLMNAPYIKRYWNHLIKDSIYLIKGEVLIYGIKDKDEVELLEKRYHRYSVLMEKEKIGNEWLLNIKVGDAQNHKGKEFFYFIGDSIYQMIELLSEFLTN